MSNRIILLLLIIPAAFSCAKKGVDSAPLPEDSRTPGGYVEEGYTQVGVASWYGIEEHNRYAANGERFSKYAYTAAHKSLPMGTVVRVTNLENGRDILLEINDRGPFVEGRIIDLSHAAARSVGMVEKGTVKVKVEVVSTPSTRDANIFDALYTIQVASFSDRGNAMVLKRKLDIEYDDVRIKSVRVSGDDYYRVRIGRYSDRKDAERDASKLRRDGHKGRIIIE